MTDPPDDFVAAFPTLVAIAKRVAFRILGDGSDAEDVAQETLARALVRWRRVAPYAEPWTATTASNLAIGIWRRRGRITPPERALSSASDQQVPSGSSSFACCATCPAVSAMSS